MDAVTRFENGTVVRRTARGAWVVERDSIVIGGPYNDRHAALVRAAEETTR